MAECDRVGLKAPDVAGLASTVKNGRSDPCADVEVIMILVQMIAQNGKGFRLPSARGCLVPEFGVVRIKPKRLVREGPGNVAAHAVNRFSDLCQHVACPIIRTFSGPFASFAPDFTLDLQAASPHVTMGNATHSAGVQDGF